MLPVAGIRNASPAARLRARLAAVRRHFAASLGLSIACVALLVGAAQTGTLMVVHDLQPPAGLVAAVIVVLAGLACLWIGSFGFVRLVTRRTGIVSAIATTLAFYGFALPFGTNHTLLSVFALLPPALLATPLLRRVPWPRDIERPRLPLR